MHRVKLSTFAARRKAAAVLCVLLLGLALGAGAPAEAQTPEASSEPDLWCCSLQAAPYWRSSEVPPDLRPRAKRHHEFLQAGIPLEYRSRRSPYPAATKFIVSGGELYRAHCAACHGTRGLGNGKAGNDLRPSPALLAYMAEQPRSVDEYLLWTISEGGKPFGTAMPAFKETLTEPQIWQIVVFMRAGFPPADAEAKD